MELVTKMERYIPQEQRKKILLLCDDIRTHSGIGTVAKEIVLHTAHHYNWVQVGAAINHPEQGKRLDISEETNKLIGVSDSSVVIYPSNGYGSSDLVRQLIQVEKPDAILYLRILGIGFGCLELKMKLGEKFQLYI
jgi:hypothetical protein